MLRLVELRTADPDVMRIKAALVLDMWGGEAENFDRALNRVREAAEIDEMPLSVSLMRDVLHGLGAEYRVSA